MKTPLSIATAIALVVGTSFVLPVSAENTQTETAQEMKMEKRKHHKRGGMHKMLRKLDLTEEQKTQVKTIVQKYKPEMTDAEREAKKADKQARKQEVIALVTAPQFDESQAQAIVEAGQANHQQKMLDQLRMQNEIYQILDSDQQAKFQEMLERGKKRRR
ncbi:periplasmic heavy metal sensor [Shewanella maritima]|uniref:Periplasmic heavy metal sensor n=1 Tax=Shewanella maritima TaxID=2520507 RepID=A0A411PI70_9GAMM|nr:Spy/CpxP family protein refolding chaperone [Shewanella maritima]QBF83297.1 periplasmic heavy metal sensor [Shewanella maritima]